MSSASADRRRPARIAHGAVLLLTLMTAAAPAAAEPAVAIVGNRALAERTLRDAAADELERFTRLGGRRADADDAAFRMALAYRKEGFAFAEVAYRVTGEGEGVAVEFTVDEGPRVLLGNVTIEGAAAVAADSLRELFPGASTGLFRVGGPTPYVEADIKAAVRAVTGHYLERGYLDVAVAGPEVVFREERTRADVGVAVTEGPRYRVRAVAFSGDLLPEAARGLRDLERRLVGEVFTGPTELIVRGGVSELYGSLGYPEVAAQVVREPGQAPGDVLLSTEITAGPRVRIAAIEISGNARTSEKFIRRLVPLGADDWYDLRKVEKAIRNLHGTGVFSRVDVRLAGDAGASERTLTVEVEEVPARELSFSLGWSAYERLRGEAGYRHLNLFGTGRSAGLEGAISVKRTSVTADLTDPRFFGTRFEATIPVSYRRDEEPAFTKRQVEVAPQLSWQISRDLSATARYPLEYSWTGSYSEEAPPDLAAENYRLARLALQLRYDTRRQLFFPSRGLVATIAADAANSALGSELQYLRFVGTVRWYLSLTGSTVLAMRGESGLVVPTHGGDDIPLGERFFLGGERSVRSFRESRLGPLDDAGEPVGGLGYNLLSVEVRQRIAGNLSAAIFADLGNISPNRDYSSLAEEGSPAADRGVTDATRRDFLRDFRAGVGVGLRYLFPIGPARFDVAWNPDRREGEDGYVANLSVGIPF